MSAGAASPCRKRVNSCFANEASFYMGKFRTSRCKKQQAMFAGEAVYLRGATRSMQACEPEIAGLDTSCSDCSRPQAAPGLRLPDQSKRRGPAHLQLLLCELEQVIKCLIVDLTVGGPAAQLKAVNMLRKSCRAVQSLQTCAISIDTRTDSCTRRCGVETWLNWPLPE